MSDLSNKILDVGLNVVLPGNPDRKKMPTMGPIRLNLEAFGVAILAAVLLKWFCLEAYQIPTSSMQPTLMGSTEAGVYDRILVDKLLPTIREPQRWDITVFRYPLQKNQNYVKRLVGMPGDRLYIAGGNLYQVEDKDGKRSYTVLQKPDDLQEQLWKNVYPARRLVLNESRALGLAWTGSGSNVFTEDADGITIDLGTGNTRNLQYRDQVNGGFVDLVWDGYPTATAAAIREKAGGPQEIVPDARLTASVTSDQVLDELAFEIDVQRPAPLDRLTFALVARGGKGWLQVRKDTVVLGKSAEFALELPAGATTELSFAHVDDQLIAWREGTELLRFDTADWACREGCEVTQQANGPRVTPQFTCKGKGKVRLTDIRLDRDLHYTRSTAPEIIEVPAGHYFMMGDNTLQSIDSRGWSAVTIYEKDGVIVEKGTEGARAIRGNKRPMALGNAPDRDETPIAIPSEHAVVMIDEYGEIMRLAADPGSNWGEPQQGSPVVFQKPGTPGQGGRDEFIAEVSTNGPGISFVPRADIQDRGVMVFYPCRPLASLFGSNWPGRFGFVR